MPSDGPYNKGDRVYVWRKDESKKKSEGVWVRGIVVSQEGATVLVEVHRAVLRVNQSKVRCDHDPWHDVAIPLKSDDGSRGHHKMGDLIHMIPTVFWNHLQQATVVTNMRSVTIRFPAGRAISLRSRHTSLVSLRVPVIRAFLRVNLCCLV